ncbi:twitching motility protein PilT [Sporosalibacterium faouarense]|uniref:twitching motility protein PilT n=1 Tax=Sporosalibacterium faouarense TaxID=516123 RepID=UPI00141C3525|nr:twitching motility protein PilT [Sporosalibacterium faouarense]MTI47019.1 hypothetical protein [Bacillota bacterium]
MIKFVSGPKGSGKTKRLIEMANSDSKQSKGDIVFVDVDNSHMLNLNHKVRYINAMEYNIDSIDTFRGFLCGIIAEDYDIEKIYIDGFFKMLDVNIEEFKDLIQKKIDKFNIAFVIGVDSDKVKIPDELKSLIIK